MDDYEFTLEDRISKIRAINEQYDLENNSYIAFSGGKDSTVLHYLVDMALPNNKIPRVFSNTGMEYMEIVKFVKNMAKNDDRIVILNQTSNIKGTLEKYGYPFKSKEHSQKVYEARRSWEKHGLLPEYLIIYRDAISTYTNKKGETKEKINLCPPLLKCQFEKDYDFKISKMCCIKLKEKLADDWQKENPSRKMTITGMMKEEGGTRLQLSCLSKNNTKFNPLSVITSEFEDEFIKRNNIEICKLYYPPYNFKRTGCKGCPYNKDIEESLGVLYRTSINEYKQCLHLWKPVYDEYIRLGYRLNSYPHERGVQMTLDDFLKGE